MNSPPVNAPKHGPHRLAAALHGRFRRVIFLDFDGVLHPPQAIEGAKPPLKPHEILQGWPATFQHLGILKELLHDHPDVCIVVSSSWRMFLNDQQLGELLSPIAHWYGGSIGSPYLARDTAIRAWLELNRTLDFAVLDDKPEYFPDAAAAWPTLILCDSNSGLSNDRVQRQLRAWLCQPPVEPHPVNLQRHGIQALVNR